MSVNAYICVKTNSQLDPLAFHIGFRHFLMNAAPQWTSWLNLKKKNKKYLNIWVTHTSTPRTFSGATPTSFTFKASKPAQAIMTPLSVHSLGGGKTASMLKCLASPASPSLTARLLATPPDTTRWEGNLSSQSRYSHPRWILSAKCFSKRPWRPAQMSASSSYRSRQNTLKHSLIKMLCVGKYIPLEEFLLGKALPTSQCRIFEPSCQQNWTCKFPQWFKTVEIHVDGLELCDPCQCKYLQSLYCRIGTLSWRGFWLFLGENKLVGIGN